MSQHEKLIVEARVTARHLEGDPYAAADHGCPTSEPGYAGLLRRLAKALEEADAHQCGLPSSIIEALNSGDGTYRP